MYVISFERPGKRLKRINKYVTDRTVPRNNKKKTYKGHVKGETTEKRKS